ncbi:SLC13 family permease [Anaerotignum faecicola]
MKEKLLTFFKKETILCIACLLAALSACIVPPDTAYLGYVDTRVLILLFSLMAVLAGFRALGIFDRMANLLLARAKKMRQLALTLVMLCFFSAMLVTNDVALITFVPFTILLLQRVHLEEKLIPVIVLQTIAANLGSMLTPVGNPQNLYLYTISGIGVGAFFRITLPFVLVSFFLLLLLCFLQGNTPLATQPQAAPPTRTGAEKQQLFGLTVLFFLCLLAVFRILPVLPLLALALVWFLLFQKGILKEVDYCLLLTFIFFFILIGNLGRISAIREALQALLCGREVLVSFLSCQFISNVPAAVLLSEFTDRYDLLLAGVNIGGLGTLIASMASLISYKYFAQIPNVGKGRYLLWFTLANLLFAVILLGLAALLPS